MMQHTGLLNLDLNRKGMAGCAGDGVGAFLSNKSQKTASVRLLPKAKHFQDKHGA